MTAIRIQIFRTIMAFAGAALAATAFAQAPDAPKAVKINPETADAEVGQQLQLSLSGLQAESKAMWIALPPDMAPSHFSRLARFK